MENTGSQRRPRIVPLLLVLIRTAFCSVARSVRQVVLTKFDGVVGGNQFVSVRDGSILLGSGRHVHYLGQLLSLGVLLAKLRYDLLLLRLMHVE